MGKYELGNIYCDDFLNNGLQEKSVQLIIADPPYFEVKGDFDFIWDSFDDYLADVEKWAKECKRILADNGTLFWYGDAKNIAYSQVILDRYFNLQNSMVWENTYQHKQQIRFSEDLRSFAPLTERILMYSNDYDVNALGTIYDDPNNFTEIKQYLRSEKQKSGLKSDWFVSVSSTYCSHFFALTSQWAFPTEKAYKAFQKSGFFQKPYDDLRKEYEDLRKEYEEDLRKEYEDLRRPFNNVFNLQEVLNFSNESQRTGKNYDHDTVKPEKLTRALILTCSRPGDIVFVPFSGSGTECAMAQREGRRYIGFDVCEKYVIIGNERCKKEKIQPTLFDPVELTKETSAPELFEGLKE